jgi:3-hydroxybutyryl-CoA dehydrogenase
VTAIRARGGDPGTILVQLRKSLERQVQKGKLAPEARDRALACVAVSSNLAAVAEADLVIESSVEELEHKTELLAELERHMTPGAILATNTSSLRLETLAEGLTRPTQFVGLHFFNPVTAMPLVEIGLTDRTAPGVAHAARSFATAIGKTPVEMQSSPGYVVNRLLVPYLLHAIETLQDGIANADAIDSAMKLGAAHPMGPLALADFIGLDIVLAMSRSLHAELGESRYRAPSLLRRLVLAGALGRKSGLGLWDYRGATPVPNPECMVVKPSLRPAAVDAAE